MSRQATIKELQDWRLSGATWRAVRVTDERAVIDLCSCSGEPMDRVESDEPDVIEFVRVHVDD
jgi:hypothetical protein